jgi:hypothetical protein
VCCEITTGAAETAEAPRHAAATAKTRTIETIRPS